MAAIYHQSPRRSERGAGTTGETVRYRIIEGAVIFMFLVVAIRLFQLQVVQGRFYSLLASGQRELYEKLLPERGQILVRDRNSAPLYPVAANKDLWTVYSDNRKDFDLKAEVKALAPLFVSPVDPKGKTPEQVAAEAKKNLSDKEQEILKRLSVAGDPYEVLFRGADEDAVAAVRALGYANVAFAPERARVYPEHDFGGQILGFVGYDGKSRAGKYGIEGYWEKELAGRQGFISIGGGGAQEKGLSEKQDGSSVVLTVDRTLQAYVCGRLKAAMEKHQSSGGSVVMVDPSSGAILAMCGAPDFDPNTYNKVEDAAVFNNPSIWNAYEPGSVIKAITMAGALDVGAVTPSTTYNDTGEERFGAQIVKNSDRLAHGIQTMVDVLDNSLNTGAIFAMRATGTEKFKSYLEAFGFGTRTGIELDTESPGNLASLKSRREVDAASASFGQGITATPLQVAVAYAAIANGGKLMRPYVVDSIVHPDGTAVKTQPRVVRQVISDRASSLLTGMLVSVVKNGHGKRAGVPGYFVAGKTGTAQIPKNDGTGYEPDPFATIGTFAGFAPVTNPRFAMVVRIDRPKDVQFAESSAAPLFGEIASFALRYLEVPPDDAH